MGQHYNFSEVASFLGQFHHILRGKILKSEYNFSW